ncbi:MAG: hypothetical protein QOE65_786 [Solirubrobacteraceae bacterium]|nr:hypothetical protein [Solirubrobacteraceae bacterium]
MLHLRIVAPAGRADQALDVLTATPSVCNVVRLPGVALRPKGDVILADVAREDASVVLSDLRRLEIHHEGSISVESVDTQISDAAERAERAAPGLPSDAVVWEEVEARTSETTELSASFLAFMVLACLIAAVGIYLDTPILIIGAMVVGPEFGPLAGLCVALVSRRRGLAGRSLVALLVGFPAGITAAFLATVAFKHTGVTPQHFDTTGHALSVVISKPDFLSFFVALCAGIAGVLSLTSAKSGALIGVLISVTTIPAAANIGVAAAYGDGDKWTGSVEQLAINLGSILLAGLVTLGIQRALYARRRAAHERDLVRTGA